MRKLKFREVQWLAQDHLVRGMEPDLENTMSLTPKLSHLTTRLSYCIWFCCLLLIYPLFTYLLNIVPGNGHWGHSRAFVFTEFYVTVFLSPFPNCHSPPQASLSYLLSAGENNIKISPLYYVILLVSWWSRCWVENDMFHPLASRTHSCPAFSLFSEGGLVSQWFLLTAYPWVPKWFTHGLMDVWEAGHLCQGHALAQAVLQSLSGLQGWQVCILRA